MMQKKKQWLAACFIAGGIAAQGATTVLETGFEGYVQTNTSAAIDGLVDAFPSGDTGDSFTAGAGVQWVGANPDTTGNSSTQVLAGGDQSDNFNQGIVLFDGGSQSVNGLNISFDFYNAGSNGNANEGVRVAFRNSANDASGFFIRNDRDGTCKINGTDDPTPNAGQDTWQHFSGTFVESTPGVVGSYDFTYVLTNLETGVEITSGILASQAPGAFADGYSAGLFLEIADPNDPVGFTGMVDNVSVVLLTDVLPPASLDASLTNGTDVALSWSGGFLANTYNVYRSTNSGSYGAALATGISGTSYVDGTTESGKTYYYVVSSIDASLNESGFSPEVAIQTDTQPPAAPSNLVIATNMAMFELTWDANAEPDLASYSVYRSTTSGSFGAPLASGLTTNAFSTGAPTVGESYYYVVTATDTIGNESVGSGEVAGSVSDAGSKLFFVLADGDVYGFNSIASNGWSTMAAGVMTNGTLLANIPAYSNYQAFANLPNWEIYGIDAAGDVLHWSNVADFLTGEGAATTVATGTYAPEGASTERIHGASYDPATKGFYTVLEFDGGGAPDGDVALYSNLTDFVSNTPYVTNVATYGGNKANFYYGGGDVPNNVGSYTNISGNLPYFQVPGSGQIESWVSLEAYIDGPGSRSFQLPDFSGDRTIVGAFAVLPAITAIGDLAIVPLGANDYELSWAAEELGTYALQVKDNLVFGSWSNMSRTSPGSMARCRSLPRQRRLSRSIA